MIRSVCIALCLGLITTYAVAVIPPNLPAIRNFYGRYYEGGSDTRDGLAPLRMHSRWKDVYYKAYYNDPTRALVAVVPSPSECRRNVRDLDYGAPLPGRCGTGMPRMTSIQIEEWGWPMRCAWSWSRSDPYTGSSYGNCIGADWDISRPQASAPPAYRLPYGIAWTGFTANTAAFTSPWMAVLLIPHAIRKVRRRRGGCARCGYCPDGLPVDAPCPECGLAPANAAS